jgi:hypothetical protein
VFDHPGWGLSGLIVWDLPNELPKEKGGDSGKTGPHQFIPEHVPEDLNYSHCELALVKDGKKVTGKVNPPEIVKKEFRTFMSDRALIMTPPTGE